MKHLMIDLETFGTGPDAMPISIGAVKFDSSVPVSLRNISPQTNDKFNPNDPKYHGDAEISAEELDPPAMDTFHVAINPISCEPFGLKMDASTIMFWMDDRMAQARSNWMAMEKLDIATVLMAFTAWLNPASQDEYQVWGNGATFDNVIMNSAYKKVLGTDTKPWGFRQDRCYRTVVAIAMDQGINYPAPEDMGITHTALADAMWQARKLQLIYEALGWKL